MRSGTLIPVIYSQGVAMKKQDLRAAAEKAQIEINDQINQFIAKLDEASDDPNDFITMSALDTKELNKAKKASSSRKGSA